MRSRGVKRPQVHTHARMLQLLGRNVHPDRVRGTPTTRHRWLASVALVLAAGLPWRAAPAQRYQTLFHLHRAILNAKPVALSQTHTVN